MRRCTLRWIVVAVAAAAGAGLWVLAWRTGAVHRSASAVRHAFKGRQTSGSAPDAPIPVSRQRLEAGRAAIATAVAWSLEERVHALVVDKSAYTLFAYRDGVEAGSWPVELGPDPVAAKEQEGDLRTPEGVYQVTWRREQGHTSFYRALLLDYPNAEDRRAGRTGSHIEIHGMGSGRRPGEGGRNWTLGCVALSNDDMDALLALGDGDDRVAEGTPVTIVYAGSLPEERYRVVGGE